MEEFTTIRLSIPKDFDYKLNLRLAELRRMNIKRTKADEIIKLAQIGLLKENIETILNDFENR
jgi:hypothetical protein